ncbi:MAG: hypothetical protein R8K46_03430 [Mariprofundaceae bacterium]
MRKYVLMLLMGLLTNVAVARAAEGELHQQHVRETVHVEHLQLTPRSGIDEDAVFFGANIAWFVNKHLFWGGGAYGAALGQRGGFFIGGFRLGAQMPLGEHGFAEASVMAGGGGGGAAGQGDGLFVRPEISLGFRLSPAWDVEAHVAYIRFRGSQIASPVFGGGLSYHYMRLFGAAGDR